MKTILTMRVMSSVSVNTHMHDYCFFGIWGEFVQQQEKLKNWINVWQLQVQQRQHMPSHGLFDSCDYPVQKIRLHNV